MLKHLQPSALAVGAFVGHVIPLLLSWFFFIRIHDAVAAEDAQTGRSFLWLMLATNLLGSVVGGFVAARLSRHQPMLHGLVASLLGGTLMSIFRGFNLGSLIYYAVAGVVGGWLWTRWNRRAK